MITQTAFGAKILAGIALVLLFGSGVVVGLAWDQTANANTLEEIPDEPSRREGERRTMIVDNVGLSAPQKATVDSLYFFHRQRMSDLDSSFRQWSQAVISDLIAEIKQVLDDEQRVEYDVLLAEHDERRTAERAARRRNPAKK